MQTKSSNAPHIKFDLKEFHPLKICPITHNLAEHPLLSFESLATLARRLPAKQVRFHKTSARPESSFVNAEREHRHNLSLDEALAQIEQSGSWIALHNVQTEPAYKALLDQALDEVSQRVGHLDPGMFNRALWIFIQSPGSVTPFHMDHEQNFLMQIQGEKLGYVWAPGDALSPLAIEEFHAINSREQALYTADMDAKATVFNLKPGNGAYMPFTSPHMIKNGNNVSVTISMTFCSRYTQRMETLNRLNALMRRKGLNPAPVAQSPLVDQLKSSLYQPLLNFKARAKGLPVDKPYWA